MASPIAHSFAGFWTFLILAKQLQIRLTIQWRQYLPQVIVLVVLANLADLDFFISLALLGNDNLHRGFTHSLTVSALVAMAFGCVWRITPGFWRSTTLYFTAYGSHLLIDFYTGSRLGWNDTASGIPLLWPLATRFSSPLVLVPGVRYMSLAALLSTENAWSCIYELLTFGAITAVLLARRARHERNG